MLFDNEIKVSRTEYRRLTDAEREYKELKQRLKDERENLYITQDHNSVFETLDGIKGFQMISKILDLYKRPCRFAQTTSTVSEKTLYEPVKTRSYKHIGFIGLNQLPYYKEQP